RVRVRPVRVERQLAHLRRGRLAHLVAVRVADLHGEQPGERVEVALAVRVLEVAALPPDDDRHVRVGVAAHTREVQPEVVTGCLLQLGGREARGGGGHVPPRVDLAARYCQTTLPRPRAIATRKIALATTFTCGGTATLAIPQTKIGKVCTGPALRYVITKSSIESAKPRSPAASIAGAMSGSVTFWKVFHSLAPRSIAASSRCLSNPMRRAFTVTTTKLMVNITCAMKIVQKPS